MFSLAKLKNGNTHSNRAHGFTFALPDFEMWVCHYMPVVFVYGIYKNTLVRQLVRSKRGKEVPNIAIFGEE